MIYIDRKPRSRASSEEVAQAVTEAQTSRTIGNLFGWGQSNTNNPSSGAYISTNNTSYGAAFGNTFGGRGGNSASKAVPKTISTFETMHKQHTTTSLTSTLDTLHGAFISKGMTDKEEELHMAKVLSRNQKSNTNILVKSGITTILLTILDKHETSYEVQISAINALNSIALDPTYRNELNNEGIFNSVVKAYVNCLQLKATFTPAATTNSTNPNESDLIDIDNSNSNDASAAAKNKHNVANSELEVHDSAAGAEMYTDIAAKRVLLIILNITIGKSLNHLF